MNIDKLSNDYLDKNIDIGIEKSLENNINNFIDEINDIKIDNNKNYNTISKNKKDIDFEKLSPATESLYTASY